MNFRKVKPGSTIDIVFETMAGATGAPITMSGLTASTTQIKVYKNLGTTEQASAASFSLADTDGIDFDGLTGIHGFSINLADNTTDGFYVAGARYVVVVTGLTVDSQTVRFVADTFEIGYSQSIIDTTIASLSSQTSFTLTTGPAEANALIGCTVLVHDKASAVQIAMGTISAYAVTTKTVTLAVDPAIFTMAAGDNISIFPRTNLYSVSGSVAAPAGTIDANVVQIGGDTQSASDLKDFADAGYDPATNKVQGVVLVDTTTTNTDMRGTNSAALAATALSTATWTGTLATNIGTTNTTVSTNLNATVSSRMATYTQPTGFLAATFPTGTVANTTNITAGTITTATNLTNAPTSGDLTATMKTSVTTAATAATPIAASVSGNVVGSVGSLASQAKTDVNNEVLDVLTTDTHAELGAVPAATSSLKDKIVWLFMMARNRITQTATTQLLKADNNTTTVGTATVSDDGTTFTKGKIA